MDHPDVTRPALRRWVGAGCDVIHLHHGVRLNTTKADSTAGVPERFLAAGEEKTINIFPAPYAYEYSTSDSWTLNYMLHNLIDELKPVWITYDIEFIPADSPAAVAIVGARPIWMDVQNGSVYPVFDVIKGSGSGGLYTYPTDAEAPYGDGPAKNEWTVEASWSCGWPTRRPQNPVWSHSTPSRTMSL